MIRRLNPHLLTTLWASIWMFAGRGVGLVWTVAIIHQLGIGDYGTYAMGFALSTIIAVPIDNYFFVGSVRSSDEDFRHDRSMRLLVGVALFVSGLALYQTNFVIALGIVLSGAEISYNAFQSGWMRAGRPDRLNVNGAVRQTASIGLALPYLYLSNDPTIEHASLVYCVPYVALMAIAAYRFRHDMPRLPTDRSRVGVLLADAICIAVYEQGDVLLLGAITDKATAGYYSTAAVTASAASAIGISYAQTFHEKLRGAEGDARSGPSPRHSFLLGTAIGAVVLLAGIALAIAGTTPQLWGTFVIMSAFTTLRFVKHTLTIVLIVQRRDRARVNAMTLCIFVKAILILALASAGAVGCAVAVLLTELVLVFWYVRLVYPERGIGRANVAVDKGQSGAGT